MEVASGFLSAGFMMVCLLGDARLSSVDRSHCPCPVIPPLKGTRTPPEDCRQIDSTFRYTCLDGTLRKAGSSNRIKCQLKDGRVQWEQSFLICIDDPRKPKLRTTTKTTVADDHSDSIQNTTTTSAATFSTSRHMNHSAVTQEEKTSGNVDEKQHDAVTLTTLQTWNTGTPGSSQGVANISMPESHRGSQTAAVSSVVLAVVVCALIGIGCLLHRRRPRNNTSQHPVEELVPMKPPTT